MAVLALLLVLPVSTWAENRHQVDCQGDQGPGVGKRIVFLAGDHEYRGEETLPALARILAKRYGFTCHVIFTIDPVTGYLQPGSSDIAGLEILKQADLLVVFLRFQDFPDDQMQHIVDYLDRGGPVVGLRTSTHAFKIDNKDAKFARYSTFYQGKEYEGGFGRQVLGETWVGHYGRNHKQSSRLLLQKEAADHPVLRGVEKVHVQCGGYNANPIEGSTVLAKGQILDGMTPDSPTAKDKEILPVAWVRLYKSAAGNSGRVFATTHGASEDILNPGFRRLLLNAHLWCLGMEKSIQPDGPIEFVGPYRPSTFKFKGFVQGVKPADLAGWESPIMPKGK
jgi:hypothetical protein